ncbi:transposase-like protein [Paraburkholderia sp. MM5477-R1]|uniref:DDE domain-containing protein n=1 Tax=Paraburkholderia tuberum TaxID=157910 RepID=A0A1H1KJF3_9BURK|nr:DDE domain-containing protein [Paraburkholderia tuberum]
MGGTTRTTESSMKTMNPAMARVLKRLHYPLDVMLTCVRWYVAYPLSLRHLEDMTAERGVSVDHSTVHRWAIKVLPVLEKAFRRRKRPVGKSWRMDETYSTRQGGLAVSLPGRRQGRQHLVEQDHRAIKRRTRPMLGFKTFRCARILLAGIEIMHMIAKGQMKCARGAHPSAADQFYELAT